MDEATFDCQKLDARGLSRYLFGACGCQQCHRIVVYMFGNGVRQYRLQCIECGRMCKSDMPQAKLSAQEMQTAPLVRNNVERHQQACERCHEWKNGVERHHWAPFSKFGTDSFNWPTAWLCPDCHTEWHERMHGYRFVRPARQRGIDVSPPSPAPQLTGKSHDEMVEIMQAWFFENFEDPAESTPYESAEGGYQYIWGGPYDANEELQAAFLDIPLADPAFEPIENAIKEAVEEIEQHGWEWAPHGNRLVEECEP